MVIAALLSIMHQNMSSFFPHRDHICLLTRVPQHISFGGFAVLAYTISPCIWVSVTSWYHNWSNDRRARKLSAIPIPRARGKWPGNIDIMFRFAKDLRTGYALQAMNEILDEYNCETLNTRILWKDNIISRNDIHIHAVHSTSFNSFERGPEQAEKMQTFLGRGIFVTDGEAWKQNRAMIRPFLGKERVSDFEIFAEHTDKVLSILSDALESGSPIDAQDLFSRFTLDSGSDFLLGFCPDSLSAPRPIPFKARIGPKGAAADDEFGTFSRAFEEIQVTIAMRFRLGAFFPLYEFFGDRTLPDAKVITRWIKPVVEKALQDKAHEETVRYGLLNVLMAARDTTAALLTFTVYLLAMHPEVLQRLRKEVLDVCGSSDNPTPASARKMTYSMPPFFLAIPHIPTYPPVTAVLNETLRLFPPAPMGIRNATEEVLLPSSDGRTQLYFPRGARFTWLMLPPRARTSGAPTPTRSIPTVGLMSARRAIAPTLGCIFHSSLAPQCQAFALSEASFMMARLLQTFSGVELVPDALPEGARPPEAWKLGKGRQAIEKFWPNTAVTEYLKGGLWGELGLYGVIVSRRIFCHIQKGMK
ncbi:hypothetical protein A0H81_05671 [Grifola frondosa]|uniref:Uncharacterized protein n=1 Tax=Grifola frondosa TaxID=5627 RepID=A0A1C7MCB3_GRIFR|nr:hypothetical protein A0H81_05671 [Grifola frondosa]